MRNLFNRPIPDNDGVTAIEYGFIAVAAITAFQLACTNLGAALSSVARRV